jgi:hypothetical protein
LQRAWNAARTAVGRPDGTSAMTFVVPVRHGHPRRNDEGAGRRSWTKGLMAQLGHASPRAVLSY